MEYRSAVEPFAAALAARRGSTADRRVLVRMLDGEVADLAACHRVDSRFHLAVAAGPATRSSAGWWNGPGDATATELAGHLGVTKQAASQLVDELVRKGYAERRPHPQDARARLVVLTARGWDCTRAAEEASAEAVRPWVERLGAGEAHALAERLLAIAPNGPIRPTW
ncbi:MarR family transcriptional regulator [Streptomyces sp. BH106]|uniref:MarR family winged helix-turn-helix transcriptional regulator n=1 Tax=Streptomyces sp. BH106 TaxID=3410409 RepID=UPI003CF675BE